MYYSQYGEDRFINEHLSAPGFGRFVEVGADDGKSGSNTLFFEQSKKWEGLVVEADPHNRDKVRENRACKLALCACGDPLKHGEVAFFTSHPCHAWSGLEISPTGGTVMQVQVKRLDTLLDEADITEIDLLSLDTEGTELEVWSTFDPNKYKPRIVIIEYDTVGQPKRDKEILGRLAMDGYARVHQTPGNLIFTREIA